MELRGWLQKALCKRLTSSYRVTQPGSPGGGRSGKDNVVGVVLPWVTSCGVAYSQLLPPRSGCPLSGF